MKINLPLSKLNENDVCAEIGVWRGNFSKQILCMKPSELHLIDPWVHQDHIRRCYSVEQSAMDSVYNSVTDKFKKDPNPEKVNLGVGTFQDAQGKVPILECVNRAETLLLKEQDSKNYLGIEGSPDFARCVQRLLYGEQHEFIQSQRIVTAQTPGGTGSLRVAGEFIKKFCPDSKIWLSDPTWSNHQSVFQAAGFEIVTYPYYD